MKIIVAKTAGFCFGVKRAVQTVYSHVSDDKAYTYGPIIHNDEVVNDLKNKGVRVINTPDELKDIDEGTVILRAHGVSKEDEEQIRQKGLNVVDATCPFVLKIHKIVKEASANGEYVIIIGDETHPEVIGIKSHAGEFCSVIDSVEKAEIFNNLHENDSSLRLCIVSQTTFNCSKFKELVDLFCKKSYNSVNVLNTICSATGERQEEAALISQEVDIMIVIGGINSSNSRKLYEICSERCRKTFFIQTADDMDYSELNGTNAVGITAGASTPDTIIKEVQTRCQISALNRC